jgi:hypothetical protein
MDDLGFKRALKKYKGMDFSAPNSSFDAQQNSFDG